MKQILSIRLFLSASLLMAVSAIAGPLQRADVINAPLWVIHVDADALRQTVVGQFLLAEMQKPDAQKKFAAFQAIFNFDPRKELHGLTLYGASKAEEDGVLLVYADFDAARLTTLAEGAKDHQSSTHGQYVIHNWIDEKKQPKNGVQPRTYAAISGKVVIFAQKETRVAEALDVLDRTKPNLDTNPQFTTLGTGTGFIQAAAGKMEMPANDPNAALLKQSKMVMLDLGESQRRVEGTLTLATDGEEAAGQLEAVGRGLIGLMSLQSDKPENVKLAQALAVERAGANVMVRLAMPADDVVGMMKADAARKAAKQ